MSRRITVSPSCASPCPSCGVCDTAGHAVTFDEVSAAEDETIVLGGGDATRWPYLLAFLEANAKKTNPRKIWLEAPAASFTPAVLQDLAKRRVTGVRIQTEALGARMLSALGVGDGEQAIEQAEKLGLLTEARLCVRPKTFPIVAPLARRLNPRLVWLEILRQDWGAQPAALDVETIDKALSLVQGVRFSTHRARGTGYLPPCVMPASWRTNRDLWQATTAERERPNDVLPICAGCSLNMRCQWTDVGALSDAARASAAPIHGEPAIRKVVDRQVPEIIVRKRPMPDVICTEPWTTIEIPAQQGFAYQCGADWSNRVLGSIHDNTLAEIWNGAGFQEARRLMGRQQVTSDLCKPICTRLYDGALHENVFKIRDGSPRFVENQLLLAEEMAERKEVLRSKPLHLTLFPSSYCNYDCVFCEYGTLPRVDMPDRVWDELPDFLPTLSTLTLLGGEPLASPRVWDFLTGLDTVKYPDVRLDLFTNGALMTEKALRKVQSAGLGEITISLNAGLPDVYDRLERGTATLGQVMENVDALMRFRDDHGSWFGITLSLIVMRENAHTLIQFGQLALERNLHIRLVGLNVKGFEDLNFYKFPDQVKAVIERVDELIRWTRHVGRADYTRQAQNAREAILAEAEFGVAGLPSALVPLRVNTSWVPPAPRAR